MVLIYTLCLVYVIHISMYLATYDLTHVFIFSLFMARIRWWTSKCGPSTTNRIQGPFWCSDSVCQKMSVLRFFDLFAMRFFCEWNKTAPADSDIFWGSQHRHKSSTTSNHVEPSLLIVISTLFRDFWNIPFLLSVKCLIKKTFLTKWWPR